jgi:hypothetical protein
VLSESSHTEPISKEQIPLHNIECKDRPRETLAALLSLAVCISFGDACWRSRSQMRSSADNSNPIASPAAVTEAQEKNWGSPVSGVRLAISIEPGLVQQTDSQRLALMIQNSSNSEIRFKPFVSLRLTGASEGNSFWAPADITMPKSDFLKRVFPTPPNGEPMISLKAGESKTFNFYLEELGWDSLKSSYYRPQHFDAIVPEGRFELEAAMKLWDVGKIDEGGAVVTAPNGNGIQSEKSDPPVGFLQSKKIHLRVGFQGSHKVVTTEP